MIESKLTELLERAGERTNVGPPPIEAIRAGAARRRRRRTVAVSIVAATTVAAAVGGTTLLTTPGTSPTDPPSPAAPAAMRLVGLGHAAIAVPEEWDTNQTNCGTPLKDTVLIVRDGHLCQMSRPVGVESVDIGRGKTRMFSFTADETFGIDGVRVERTRTTCTVGNVYRVRTCSGGVRIPSLDTWFWAESSTNADEVDRILERIAIVSDRIGVPEPQLSAPNDGPVRSGELYADELTALGLKPKIEARKSPGYIPGDILVVSPSPGTMLTPGATVTVTVVAEH